MKIKTLLLAFTIPLAACAHAAPGLVDAEFWYKDCKPYSFPRGLPTITPQSPGSTVLPAGAAPTRALVHRPECARLGSLQVVDLVPDEASGITPAAFGNPAMRKFDLRDVPPPFTK